MIYAVTYEIVGITGQEGAVDVSRERILEFAKNMAQVALDHLGDSVNFVDWYDLNGDEIETNALLTSADADELTDSISQISDELKCQREGWIDLWEYSDLFELVKEHYVEEWCSQQMKQRIADVRREYYGLVYDLSEEW